MEMGMGMRRRRVGVMVAVLVGVMVGVAWGQSVEEHSKRCVDYNKKDNYDMAIEECSKAIRLAPNRAVGAYLGRGMAYFEKKDFNKAIADFTESIRLDPTLAICYHYRGFTYYQIKSYGKALVDFTEAIRLEPNNVTHYVERGRVHFFKEDYDKAIADCEAALKINPNNNEAKRLLMATEEMVKLKGKRATSSPTPQQTSSPSTLTDPRDNQTYRTVRVGGKTWMAQNLNYQTGNSWCYDNNTANCAKYGRLYDWNTAMKACPAGWRLPSRADWDGLGQAVGGQREKSDDGMIKWEAAGEQLKAKTGWPSNNNGTDNYGFSALPGGHYSQRLDGAGPIFSSIGDYGLWWSATEEYGNSRAYHKNMYNFSQHVYESITSKNNWFSVRCLRD